MSHDKAHQIEDQNKSPSEPPVFSARRLSISPVQFSKKHARLQDTDTDTESLTNLHTHSHTHQIKRIRTSQDLCGND